MKHKKAKARLEARRASYQSAKRDAKGLKRPGSLNRHKSFPGRS